MATVLKMIQATLKLADDVAGLTAGQAYSCQVTLAEVNAVDKSGTVAATMCDPETETVLPSGWELHLQWMQDWGDAESLSQYLYDNEATDIAFEITSTESPMPTITGECSARPGSYGGQMGQVLMAEVTMPCLTKPTIAAGALMSRAAEAA